MLNTTLGGDIKLAINGGSGCQLRLLAVGRGGHGNASGGGSVLESSQSTVVLSAATAVLPYTRQ